MEGINLAKEYRRILGNEFRMRTGIMTTSSLAQSVYTQPFHEIHNTALQILEIARNSLEPRSFIESYGLDKCWHSFIDEDGAKVKIVHESVAAHTNLMRVLVDRALVATYGADFGESSSEHSRTSDGYSYREICEAVTRHDLPENVIHDIPDNGSADRTDKVIAENTYHNDFDAHYPANHREFKHRVKRLLREMESKSSKTGKLLYSADKTAATIIALAYDKVGRSPMLPFDYTNASDRDKEEMSLCDYVSPDGCRLASEMWSVDFFHCRKLYQYDDTGFFTAIIIMCTLLVHHHWYQWREREYAKSN